MISWASWPILTAFPFLHLGKFLVDHTGTPVKRYTPKDAPFDIKADIEALLNKKAS